MTTIEVLRFRPSSEAARGGLVALDSRYQQEVAYRAPGLLRRTTAVADSGEWLVVTAWADRNAADGAPELSESEIGRELLTLISDVSVERYDTLD